MKSFRRSDIYESIFYHVGVPLSFDYFPFWRDVINSPRLSKSVPQLLRNQVWKCSRQVGKSATIGFLGVGLAIENPHINVVITQPTDPQISRFSVQNIKPLEQQSIIIEEIYKDKKTTQSQVKNKSYTTGSRIVLANIYSSVLSARGTPGGVTFIDEYQNTPPKNAEIVIQGMRRSPLRICVRSGTPLEEENDLQVLFDESTGTEWAVKCTHCGHWNIDLGLDNVGKRGLMCRRC
ncbi:MAG: phage terminase large subunit family protein, partial [Candidatus Subteraquimicrobiales bacterium]|nr:phage terminase large subunit family protein [Candidatus Subteraquimicrobiales bacterium]